MTPASLELSRKIYELVGEYETENVWSSKAIPALPNEFQKWDYKLIKKEDLGSAFKGAFTFIPSPNFAELIRAFVKVGEIKQFTHGSWRHYQATRFHAARMLRRYMEATTEPEGMKQVEEYLMKLL